MNKVELTVSSEAAKHIRESMLPPIDARPLVVSFSGELDDPSYRPERLPTPERALAEAEQVLQTMSEKPRFRWVIGVQFQDSVPAEEIHNIGGIPFFIPEEIAAALGQRTIVLRNGRPCFDPEPDAFTIPLRRHSTSC